MNASLTNAASAGTSMSGTSMAGAPGTGTTGALPAMTDIRDIKSIQHLAGVEWMPVALSVLGCLCLAILAWFAWKWWKKRRAKEQEVPVLPPHEQAFNDLDRLQAAADLEDKPYYFRISQILRAYVGARFHINALEMTTEELLPALKKTTLDPSGLRDVKKFCTSSDLVKYATFELGTSQRDADHDLIRALIARTAERPEEQKQTPEPEFPFDASSRQK